MKKVMIFMAVAALTAGCGRGQSEKNTAENDSVHTTMTDSVVKSASNSVRQEKSLPEGNVTSTMGKVVSEHFADLSFETALPIKRVLVRNGQHVRRGQILAQLDQFKLRNAVDQQERAIEQAQLQIEQAQLQMKDVIIAQGYDPDKMAQVPANVLHNADVKSGYALSKNQLASAQTKLEAARHELRNCVLTAPFDGVVANVTVQAHQLAQAGQPVCRIIASDEMAVEFRVMEADLCRYQLGSAVYVIPIANKSQHFSGTVCEINPVVDKQGALTIRARLSKTAELFDGMNVEVILK